MPRKRLRQQIFAQRRFRQLLASLVILSLALGFLIVPFEMGAGNIRHPADGVWWAITTVSGVGYGDLYPVTLVGRIIGSFLQVLGVAMLGLLLGIVTFAMNKKQEDLYWAREFDRFNEIEEKLAEIEKQLQYLVRSDAERHHALPKKHAPTDQHE